MYLSPTSVLSSLLASTFFITLLSIVLNNDKLTKWIGKYIFLYASIISIRLVLPLEFVTTQTIPSEMILPFLYDMLHIKVINLMTWSICLYHVLLLLWIFGSITLLLNKMKQYYFLKKKILSFPMNTDKEISSLVNEITSVYQKKVDFKLIMIPFACSPVLIGFFKPLIIIPKVNFTKRELSYILSHEIGHYYHHDTFIKLFIEILCCIYWWNPLIRIFKNQICKALEINIDCTITAYMKEEEKLDYLECLLKLAKVKKEIPNNLTAAFSDTNKANLKQRFICVLNNNNISSKRITHLFSITVIPLLLLLISFSIIIEPYSITPNDEYSSFKLDNEKSYLISKGKYYELYMEDTYVGDLYEITNEFAELPIYLNEQEKKYDE